MRVKYNLKAVNRHVKHRYFAVIRCCCLIQKPCCPYRGELKTAMPPRLPYVPKFTVASHGPPCDSMDLVLNSFQTLH